MMASAAAWADHTKEDAQATSKKLEAILHPPKRAKPKAAPAAKVAVVTPATTTATTATAATTTPTTVTAKRAAATPVVDPLYAIIVHAMSIPFDEKEREAHFRDIPKNAKELDAHLRRLDAALSAQHQHR